MAFLVLFVLPVVAIVSAWGWRGLLPVGCGIGAMIAAYFIEVALLRYVSGFAKSPAVQAMLVIGPTEELLKYGALAAAVGWTGSGRQVVLASLFCAIGFASAENALYMLGSGRSIADPVGVATIAIVRLLMPFMMHVAAGPLLVSGHAIPGIHPVVGIVAACLYHGAYDALLASGRDQLVRLAFGMIIGGLITAAIIYRLAAGGKGRSHGR